MKFALLVAVGIAGVVVSFIVVCNSRRKRMKLSSSDLFDDEAVDLREEAGKIFADPDAWMKTPNSLLGLQTPERLIQRGEDQQVRDLLRALKHGMVS